MIASLLTTYADVLSKVWSLAQRKAVRPSITAPQREEGLCDDFRLEARTERYGSLRTVLLEDQEENRYLYR
jgi:hypothetical protein